MVVLLRGSVLFTSRCPRTSVRNICLMAFRWNHLWQGKMIWVLFPVKRIVSQLLTWGIKETRGDSENTMVFKEMHGWSTVSCLRNSIFTISATGEKMSSTSLKGLLKELILNMTINELGCTWSEQRNCKSMWQFFKHGWKFRYFIFKLIFSASSHPGKA